MTRQDMLPAMGMNCKALQSFFIFFIKPVIRSGKLALLSYIERHGEVQNYKRVRARERMYNYDRMLLINVANNFSKF